jgi:predicted DCC family thiol-disulfide oxidoreductase YuxK
MSELQAAPARLDRLVYDGGCGLCHKAVNFTIAHDARGELFRFTPLESELVDTLLPTGVTRESLPDSMLVLTHDGRLLMRSDAALHIGKRVGGLWGALARIGSIVPRFLRDAVYDGVASIRHKLFAKPSDACPVLPPELRKRFDF